LIDFKNTSQQVLFEVLFSQYLKLQNIPFIVRGSSGNCNENAGTYLPTPEICSSPYTALAKLSQAQRKIFKLLKNPFES
jgi:hypothetical protein